MAERDGGVLQEGWKHREYAWALAKEDALAYRDSWRGAAKAPATEGACPRSKEVKSAWQKLYVLFALIFLIGVFEV